MAERKEGVKIVQEIITDINIIPRSIFGNIPGIKHQVDHNMDGGREREREIEKS